LKVFSSLWHGANFGKTSEISEWIALKALIC